MMPKLTQRLLFLILLSIVSLTSWSQENQGYVAAKILKDSIFSQTIQSNHAVSPSQLSFSPADGEISFTEVPQGSGNWEIKFDASPSFLGKVNFIIKYFSGIPGQSAPKYITYDIEVVESIVTAEDDYVYYPAGQSEITIDALFNDTTTSLGLSEIKVVQVSEGTAVVNGSNQIVFTPSETSEFTAFIEYIAIDDLGAHDLASVTIQSDDFASVDTMRFTVTNEQSFDVILPDDNCTVSEDTDFGQITIEGTKLTYSPDADSEGLDWGKVVDTNSDTTVLIFDVIDLENPTEFVRDDYLYIGSDEVISFDAFANDLENDGTIVNYSSQLTHDSLGLFTYTPPAWYQGKRKFFYTVYNGIEHQTAFIYINVDNQIPQSIANYSINGIENEAVVLNYDIPLTDYHFEILNGPSNGQLSILGATDTIAIDCNTLSEPGLIVYQPDTDFVGADDFDLKYFVNGSEVTIVKVNVDIYNDDQADLCHCVGPDCIWPGDINHDGRVYVDDILPIAIYMGEKGNARNDISYQVWNGQKNDNWGENQGAFGHDLKYADADGDGYITADDAISVEQYYQGVHNFTSNISQGTKGFGLSLKWLNQADTVYAGEQLCLGIDIGNENYPVVDLHGLAFDLNINPLVIDSSSTEVDFYRNGWFTYNSSQLDMFVQPYDGRIDMALSRSDGNGASGYGVVAASCFIVEDDVGGIRSAENIINSVLVETSEVSMMDSDGNYWTLPNASIELPLGKRKADGLPVTQELLVYPNPVSSLLTIHQNGGELIQDLEIVDMHGRVMVVATGLDTDHTTIDVSSLSTGLYIARTKTLKGWVNKKFKVFRN